MTGQREISPGEAAELLRSGEAQFLDVRQEYEWDAGHIEGAHHVELTELARVAEELDAERPVVLYCRSGERSAMATEALRASGWNARNLTGGLTAWTAEGLPIEPESGAVAGPRPGAA